MLRHMATLVASSEAVRQRINTLAESYRRLPAPLRAASPKALSHALRLAGGDARRLYVDEDGSVVVANERVW